MGADDLELMRVIDEQYLRTPFYGARKMAVVLTRSGHQVGRKRVTRLMRVMGIEAIYRNRTSAAVIRSTRYIRIY